MSPAEKKETSKEQHSESDVMHWADKVAERVIAEKGNKKTYTVAAGITPSGTVHIGNFREIITVDLVKRALESKGKKVRFIYSWDDYDVFRKVPADAPKKEILEKHLRYPITEVPDTYDSKHQSYAEHNEKEVEDTIPAVNICPEFIYQAEKYRNCDYAEEMKHALETRNAIKKILDKYRTEERGENWWPVSIFCDKCKKDTTRVLGWDGTYSLTYECDCGHMETFDFRKKGIAKLPWRIDWPMRWHYEKVDFEPSGKEHSTPGGSRTTGNEIFQLLYKEMPPLHLKYDFITIKGTGGKISKSLGNVVSLKDTLDIYEPDIVRWLFAGTRPDTEFAISFDADVIKFYEDFDKCERIFFGAEKVSEKEQLKQKRIYELSCVGDVPLQMPVQPGFRHITMMLQIYRMDMQKTIAHFSKEIKNLGDKKRVEQRARCAKNWLEKFAPDDFRFTVQKTVPTGLSLSAGQKKALHLLAEKLNGKKWEAPELHNEFYVVCKTASVEPAAFFTAAYAVLINKQKGPRLANFIIEIGQEKVAGLLEKV